MSIIPKNIIIQENTIDVEYNDHHWCCKGAIVLLIKNNDKIVFKCDDVANILVLHYDDGEEKFTIYLNKKICSDISEKKLNTFIVLML